jgi:SAM-dependent methyltransferase
MRDGVQAYYEGKLAAHGATPRGVDWSSADSQELRFTQLLKIGGAGIVRSINDYGCGYGALAARLRRDGYDWRYCGYDVSPEMVRAAVAVHGAERDARFTSDRASVVPADVTVASGVFNVRLQAADADWEAYMRETLDEIASLSVLGFAFNALTRHADPEKMRPDLYYADPGRWLTYCLDRYSRRVALLHDYPLFEFTVLVSLTTR